jgi:hypothetical protein
MTTWNILGRFEIFYDHSVNFVFILYISPVWVSCTKKNMSTLLTPRARFALFVDLLLDFWILHIFVDFYGWESIPT